MLGGNNAPRLDIQIVADKRESAAESVAARCGFSIVNDLIGWCDVHHALMLPVQFLEVGTLTGGPHHHDAVTAVMQIAPTAIPSSYPFPSMPRRLRSIIELGAAAAAATSGACSRTIGGEWFEKARKINPAGVGETCGVRREENLLLSLIRPHRTAGFADREVFLRLLRRAGRTRRQHLFHFSRDAAPFHAGTFDDRHEIAQ